MEIYVVKQGDTVFSIAAKFGITVEKLIIENEIKEPYYLVVGQTLVITYPVQVYIVKEGDTLIGIAEAFSVTLLQLLQNNPTISNRQYLYPGEILVIHYNNNLGNVWVAGYTYPFINNITLKKTLPYMTYILIFNYRITGNGEIVGSDKDVEVINTAKVYETATTLVLTTFSQIGEINLEIEYDVLLNQRNQDKIIENLLNIIKSKGYNGVNMSIQFITESNQHLYLNFLTNLSNYLHTVGYKVFLTINPGLEYNVDEIIFKKINYADFSKVSDGILFLQYDWALINKPPVPISIITTSSLLDYIVSQVPLDKIRIGLPTLGYDWQLPYVEGKSEANVLYFDSVLALAIETNSVIKYDETYLAAYFEYIDNNNNQHIVWFNDARSINSSLKILQSYGIDGIGVWNIMKYFAQMWLVINTQYHIVKTDI
ncbi:LysM peptidoglycan-binding domain-containing protein [Anaerosacchariphilus polymeriproducens]|uniref:LysM peptidoglycan-binding domain-containing protein n=1 Tax=Anaerosacchariphilus polymeriproducens TaxID=1812858 RepID=A0A371ATR0_9FIRM|nr:LysM peptidoglycan-binding domain-containing protein [Anaerosacchariphilus polymeriproducens]RDU22941.1 LysM peptidoglycan-binding domain-containing protein [Anaerosacchariphilus polymeriproducens]